MLRECSAAREPCFDTVERRERVCQGWPDPAGPARYENGVACNARVSSPRLLPVCGCQDVWRLFTSAERYCVSMLNYQPLAV